MSAKRSHTDLDWLIFILCLMIISLSALANDSQHHLHQYQNRISRIQKRQHRAYLAHQKLWLPVWSARRHPSASNLAEVTFKHPWNNAIMTVNHDRSTLNPKSWHYDHINFSHKDRFGRVSSPATAYLARSNATGDALRRPQKVRPVGWHQHYYQGDWLLNRGHLIAYSLTKNVAFNGSYAPNRIIGNQNDPNNLFTETAFCNQQLQYAFETRIRIALEHNKRIIYQAQPIFRSNELMARGIHLQAISTDRKFQFNVYLFNVQPGVKFNYENGQADFDSNYQFNLPNRLIRRSQYLDSHDHDMQWQREIMHLYDKHLITYQQACYDEGHILGNYIINY